MILAVSIGNEKIDCGLMNTENNEAIFVSSISNGYPKTSDEYAFSFIQIFGVNNHATSDVDAIILCSVVPDLTSTVVEALKKAFSKPVYLVKSGIKTGFVIKIDNPAELGTDIVANVAGSMCEAHSTYLLLSLGITTTISAIVNKNSTWEFIGCSFLPGIDSMKKDLQKNAAMVPEITKPKNIPLIGTNTISAVASGIYRGNAILIDGMIDAYKKELGVKDIEVFATGSQVDSVKSLCSHDIKPIPYLTLKGLTILYTKNLKK